jgi:hypothetical protein
MGKAASIIQLLIGFALGGIGLMIGGVAILGMIDPVGSKMSDDSDPFGSTNGLVVNGILLLIVSMAMLATSAFVIWRIDKKQ